MTVSQDFFLEKSKRLISQYTGASLVQDIQQTILKEVYDLKDLINMLPEERSIGKAKGSLLDLAGSIYAVTRRPIDNDDTYRAIIIATIAARHSKGKLSDIKNVVRLLIGERETRVFSYGQGTIKVEIVEPIPESIKPILTELLSLSIPAGRKIAILLETKSNNFRFGVSWGKSFPKPLRSRSFDKTLRFILPAAQSDGVLVLVESTGVWSIIATGTVQPSPGGGPPNGPLGNPIVINSNYIDPASTLGRVILKRGSATIPYVENLRLTVTKGETIQFFVNDNAFGDNLGGFEIEIGVTNG